MRLRRCGASLTGGLADRISALHGQVRTLSDPNACDESLAARFRGWTWPGTEAALDNAKQEPGGLRVQVRKVSQDIFSAGGGV